MIAPGRVGTSGDAREGRRGRRSSEEPITNGLSRPNRSDQEPADDRRDRQGEGAEEGDLRQDGSWPLGRCRRRPEVVEQGEQLQAGGEAEAMNARPRARKVSQKSGWLFGSGTGTSRGSARSVFGAPARGPGVSLVKNAKIEQNTTTWIARIRKPRKIDGESAASSDPPRPAPIRAIIPLRLEMRPRFGIGTRSAHRCAGRGEDHADRDRRHRREDDHRGNR